MAGVTRTTVRPEGGGLSHDLRGDHVGLGLGQPDHGRGVGGVDGDEQGRGGAGTERRDDHVVAVAARPPLVDDASSGHPEVHPDRRRGQQEEQGETGGERAPGVAQGVSGPAGPASLGGPVGILVVANHEHSVAKGDQHGREQGQRGQCDRDDREDHPQGHRPEDHDRHHEHRGQGEHHGERGQEDGLAGGGQRVGDGVGGVEAIFSLLAVARHDEQAVIDADGQTDHHREVHGPDRQRRGVTHEVERGEADGDAGQGEQQRDSGGDGRAERDQQQDDRRDPRQQLGPMERLGVALVEVAPHRPLAGDLGHRSRREAQTGDVVDESTGRRGQAGVVGRGQLHGDQRSSPVGGEEPRRCRLGRRIDDGCAPGSALQIGHKVLQARRVGGDGVALAVDDDGGLGPHLGEVAAQLLAHLGRDRALRIPSGTRQGAGERERERCRGQGGDQPHDHHQAAAAGREAGQPGEPRLVGSGTTGGDRRGRVGHRARRGHRSAFRRPGTGTP